MYQSLSFTHGVVRNVQFTDHVTCMLFVDVTFISVVAYQYTGWPKKV